MFFLDTLYKITNCCLLPGMNLGAQPFSYFRSIGASP